MSKFWETTERAYCYNCQYFRTDVMQGDKPMEFVGTCNNRKQSRSRTEADDMCPLYKCAQWAKKESEGEDE